MNVPCQLHQSVEGQAECLNFAPVGGFVGADSKGGRTRRRDNERRRVRALALVSGAFMHEDGRPLQNKVYRVNIRNVHVCKHMLANPGQYHH